MPKEINQLETLRSLKRINTVSDPKRLEILQRLMDKPSTISQIGRELGEFPAAIRYHINKLIALELVELREVRSSPGYSEKYYSAKADALLIQRTILPISDQKTLIFMGSHDLAMEILITGFCEKYPRVNILNFPIGSLDGLVALRQGTAHLAGCHLFDSDTNQYNHPFVKHFFPGQSTKLITLASRVQGLLFAPGNPQGVSGLEDLTRSGIRFINRNQGSGTRIWLDRRLRESGIQPEKIVGYTKELNSHTGIAHEIKFGLADLGIGLIAAGINHGLDSIPLFEEQYDLIIPGDRGEDQDIANIIDYLSTAGSRKMIAALPGYDVHETGACLEVK